MNEAQRLQYLEAIGIDSYMPRWILPVAPAPVACTPVLRSPTAAPAQVAVTPAASAPAAVPASVPAERAAGAAQPAPSAGLTAAPVAAVAEALAAFAEPQPVEKLAAAIAPATKAAVAEDPRFALSMWRASDDLLVIDSRQAHLALPTEPLLANILLALGWPRQPLPRAEVLHWPMYDHPLAPKGEAAAKETLLAMLEARLEQQPVAYVLLMGAEACHYMVPAELLPQDGAGPAASLTALRGKALPLDPVKATAIVVPSLSDMLQQPELKATTWRAIQPLRRS